MRKENGEDVSTSGERRMRNAYVDNLQGQYSQKMQDKYTLAKE